MKTHQKRHPANQKKKLAASPDSQKIAWLDIREDREGVVFPVNVQPRARTDGIIGIHEGALKIRICAPPVEGAANEALRKLLAKILKVSKSSIKILKGETSHRKLIHCRKVSSSEAEKVFKKMVDKSS